MLGKKSGFTFVELMVTVIIIGVLVTVAVPSYLRSIERAKYQSGRATLDSIRTAELNYYYANDSFTADLAVLGTASSGTFVTTTTDWSYAVGSATAAADFSATATRRSGAYSGSYIRVNNLGAWTGWTGP